MEWISLVDLSGVIQIVELERVRDIVLSLCSSGDSRILRNFFVETLNNR